MDNENNRLMMILKNPQKIYTSIKKRVTDLEPRILLLILLPLSLLIFLTLLSSTNPLSYFTPLKSYICTRAPIQPSLAINYVQQSALHKTAQLTAKLTESRIAVCLVGGARRFELTGPSIVKRILKIYPNSDLFVHSPLDENSFKFSLLKISPRIAAVRVFRATRMPETDAAVRVLTAANSPNGIQGLLQYFNLVEGCLTMIKSYQKKNNFTYDWIVRTRVDGYWSAPLGPENFVPGRYIVPPGSSYGGLNDRFGVGDFSTSVVALSRLSLIPWLNASGFTQLNSEMSFKAQLTTKKVPYSTKRLPFCVVSDRRYKFPPTHFGVPVAAIASRGPLSGAKCRPCRAVCSGPSVGNVMARLDKWWSWTEWANGTMDLCDAHGEWEKGWEKLFDAAAGKKLASARVRVGVLDVEHCVADFEEMRRKTAVWEAPEPVEICKLGLGSE